MVRLNLTGIKGFVFLAFIHIYDRRRQFGYGGRYSSGNISGLGNNAHLKDSDCQNVDRSEACEFHTAPASHRAYLLQNNQIALRRAAEAWKG